MKKHYFLDLFPNQQQENISMISALKAGPLKEQIKVSSTPELQSSDKYYFGMIDELRKHFHSILIDDLRKQFHSILKGI